MGLRKSLAEQHNLKADHNKGQASLNRNGSDREYQRELKDREKSVKHGELQGENHRKERCCEEQAIKNEERFQGDSIVDAQPQVDYQGVIDWQYAKKQIFWEVVSFFSSIKSICSLHRLNTSGR